MDFLQFNRQTQRTTIDETAEGFCIWRITQSKTGPSIPAATRLLLWKKFAFSVRLLKNMAVPDYFRMLGKKVAVFSITIEHQFEHPFPNG